MSADVPGMSSSDVTVRVSHKPNFNTLIISGKRKIAHGCSLGKYRRIEHLSNDSFERCFVLPSDTDPSAISAQLQNGRMVVTIPKRKLGMRKNVLARPLSTTKAIQDKDQPATPQADTSHSTQESCDNINSKDAPSSSHASPTPSPF